uniref:CYCLIN domain-containing protein n=1 Tax=Heterorhabditis bacteriophora TaxID=37862 RepID=A0A1I7X941_HETBA
MIKAERRLLSTLGFVVHVKHPHKLIVSYIFSLKCSERKDLIQKAWSYMNDGLRTDMFLRYTPETIACSCIFLAARTVQPPIALPSSPFPWFELFDASDRDVQTIALMLQKLYTRQKTPEWNKIDAILEKMRSQKETSEKTSKAQQVAQKLTETKSVGNGKGLNFLLDAEGVIHLIVTGNMGEIARVEVEREAIGMREETETNEMRKEGEVEAETGWIETDLRYCGIYSIIIHFNHFQLFYKVFIFVVVIKTFRNVANYERRKFTNHWESVLETTLHHHHQEYANEQVLLILQSWEYTGSMQWH